jgi:hypothetical protein
MSAPFSAREHLKMPYNEHVPVPLRVGFLKKGKFGELHGY